MSSDKNRDGLPVPDDKAISVADDSSLMADIAPKKQFVKDLKEGEEVESTFSVNWGNSFGSGLPTEGAWHDVIAVDASAEMLRRARQTTPGGRFASGDLLRIAVIRVSANTAQ